MVTGQERTRRIFISYTRTDRDVADSLYGALEEKGFQPWIDWREVKPGQSFLEAMNSGLEEASYVLALFSEASRTSRWMPMEWMAAMASKSILVIPVLIDGAEPPLLLTHIVNFKVRRGEPGDIGRVAEFFRKEIRTIAIPRPPDYRGDDDPILPEATPRQVRLVAQRCLRDRELHAFCVDSKFEQGRLQGASSFEKITSLVDILSSEDRISLLVKWMELDCTRCLKAAKNALQGTASWTWPD